MMWNAKGELLAEEPESGRWVDVRRIECADATVTVRDNGVGTPFRDYAVAWNEEGKAESIWPSKTNYENPRFADVAAVQAGMSHLILAARSIWPEYFDDDKEYAAAHQAKENQS